MRIGFFGDDKWAINSFQVIKEDPAFTIEFVVLRNDNPDLNLEKLAEQAKIPVFCPANVNTADFSQKIMQFNCDIFVSMSYDQIFKKRVISLPPKGIINCHAGALPYYRGRNVLNWVLINGEEQFGITVHYVDEKVDTGDIIIQEVFPIGIKDDYGSLLNKAYKECPRVLHKALDLIQKDKVDPVSQESIHPLGTYCSRRQPGDEWINWHWSSARIYNFIRGITLPGPCARTKYKSQKIGIVEAELVDDAINYIDIPGAIIGKSEQRTFVKTGDNLIAIKMVASISSDGAVGKAETPDFLHIGRLHS